MARPVCGGLANDSRISSGLAAHSAVIILRPLQLDQFSNFLLVFQDDFFREWVLRCFRTEPLMCELSRMIIYLRLSVFHLLLALRRYPNKAGLSSSHFHVTRLSTVNISSISGEALAKRANRKSKVTLTNCNRSEDSGYLTLADVSNEFLQKPSRQSAWLTAREITLLLI